MKEFLKLTVSLLQIVNPKGEMKGSAITGPVGKEAADLWPVCCTCLDTCTRQLIFYSVLLAIRALSCRRMEH